MSTLDVKLQDDVGPRDGEIELVKLYFQVGDWAVTQAFGCQKHANQCLRVTHIPSTACIPVCLQDQPAAQEIARRCNAEVPKFKGRKPPAETIRIMSQVTVDVLKNRGLKLELSRTARLTKVREIR